MSADIPTMVSIDTIFSMILGSLGAASDFHDEDRDDEAEVAVGWAEGQFVILKYLRETGVVFTATEEQKFLDLEGLFQKIKAQSAEDRT